MHCQRKRSRLRRTHCSSVWMSSRASCRGSVHPTWRLWRSLRVSGTNSKRPVMVRWQSHVRSWGEMWKGTGSWRPLVKLVSYAFFWFPFFFQSLRLLGKEPKRPSKPLSRSRRKDLIALITVLSRCLPISMRSTRLCHATVVLRYVFRDLPHYISLTMSNAMTGSSFMCGIWYMVNFIYIHLCMCPSCVYQSAYVSSLGIFRSRKPRGAIFGWYQL